MMDVMAHVRCMSMCAVLASTKLGGVALQAARRTSQPDGVVREDMLVLQKCTSVQRTQTTICVRFIAEGYFISTLITVDDWRLADT